MEPVNGHPAPLAGSFPALRHRNYRLWFTGQLVSFLGTWMQGTAQGYLVFELTHSPAWLGYVAFAAGIPAWLFMLLGGVAADRFPRRTLLCLTQVYLMSLSVALAALVFTGAVRPWHIVLLAMLQGVGTALDAPARHSFLLELVDRPAVANAVALNSAMFNTATALGPAVGGQLYAALGPGVCFSINAVSYLAVVLALHRMNLPPFVPPQRRVHPWRELVQGLAYVRDNPVIRTLMLLIGVTTLFGFAFVTLLPAWAVRILHGDATTNGWLLSARGAGSLAGALLLAFYSERLPRGRTLWLGALAFPVLLALFGLVRSTAFSLLVLFGIGAAVIAVFNLANAIIQLESADELRGRVMSIYSLVFFGSMPLGSLWAGAVADGFSEPAAVMAGAAATLAATALVALRSRAVWRK
ncbi:MAG: MFS transporter [Myxococcales bacterium]|nr:MFS transporter [Myxococcales bacterium]